MTYQTMEKGARISEYILLEKLGQGGFGEVWKAEHHQIPGKYVAIKIPTRPEAMDLLHKEAVFQHQLEHPNIVHTIGLNTEHNPPYFIMEYVEGKNLRQFMQQEGILPPPYAIDIAVQVLEALAYAHSRGIVHKDIKPENILVERKRITVARDHKAFLHYVKITDLGLGKMPDSGQNIDLALSDGGRTSGVRVLTGTLFYSAPEQMIPSRPIDARSDIYSVGVVLYEMLTGELPLGMDLPSELNPVVTISLNAICKKALSVDPDQRYQAARDMIEDLMKAKEDLLLRLVASGAPAAGSSDARSLPRPSTRRIVPSDASQRARGLRALEWSLLALVVLLIAVTGYHFFSARHDSDKRALEVATQPTLPMLVRLDTSPAGATVLVDGDTQHLTPCDIPLRFERHQIVLSRDFYETRLLAIEPRSLEGRRALTLLDERSGREVAIKEYSDPTVFDRLELVRQKGHLTIRTPGLTEVAVHLNGEPVGTTPYDDEVPAGIYKVRLTRTHFSPVDFELTIPSGAPVVRTLALVPADGAQAQAGEHSVHITTQPPGATLYVDGLRQPEPTPCMIRLARGAYRLRLELTYHEAREEGISVTGDIDDLPFTLTRIRSRVDFESEPTGAAVYLDGTFIGRTPLVTLVDGGPHEAEFRLETYLSKPTPFTVLDKAQSVPVRATLQKIPPGTLTLECEIAGAEISVDGKSVGTTPATGLKLTPGKHGVFVLGLQREIDVEAGAERKLTFTIKDLGMTLVPAGPFEFGCNQREVRPPDMLARTVELPAFYMDLTETTNEQYATFLEHMRRTNDHSKCDRGEGQNKDHTPCGWDRDHTPQGWDLNQLKEFFEPKRPVIGVDYYDAAAYAAWVGKRLPTEEEWEKAARGTNGQRFPWGNHWDEKERRCNWFDFEGRLDGYETITAPVGSFPAGRSPYGCFDMAGNVWEWTSTLREGPRYRIVRGTGYLEKCLPVWSRDYQAPNQKVLKTVGFRCVVDAK